MHWLDRLASWHATRRLYGKRCPTKDTDDFDHLEVRHPHCPGCGCGRCPTCVAWDAHDALFAA